MTDRQVALLVAGGILLLLVALDGGGSEPAEPQALALAPPVEASDGYQRVPGTQMDVRGAPAGEAASVLESIILDNGQPCDKVAVALRRDDGSIEGRCEDGTRYLAFDVRTVGPVAMNCTAAEAQLGISC